MEQGLGTTDRELVEGKTIEELRAERGAHRVVNVAEAVDIVKRWGRLGLHPLCGGCPPELAWTYLRRVVDDVMPAGCEESRDLGKVCKTSYAPSLLI